MKHTLGCGALNAYVVCNKWLWDRLPAVVTGSAPLRSYASLVHRLLRWRSVRQQYFGTYFFRNRPQLRLIRLLAWRRPAGAPVTLAFLGCSSGAEVYSALWMIRADRPDLRVTARAVDISRELLAVAGQGRYSLTDTGVVGEPMFANVTADEMRDLFDLDPELNEARIKPWLQEGVSWHHDDAASPQLVTRLGLHDIVIANNFLCHMRPTEAEACLRNIAQLVRPGGHLVVSGVDLDIRTRVARELHWQPVREFVEEIHDGDPSVRDDWPWKYWGLEPMRKDRPDWELRYASVFRLGPPPDRPLNGSTPDACHDGALRSWNRLDTHPSPAPKDNTRPMLPDRLRILSISPLPPSPPRFGAQARVHGLITHLAKRHDVTAIALADEAFDVEECRRAMREYSRDVIVVPSPNAASGTAKRMLQLRSLASPHSFERLLYSVDALQPVLDDVLRRQRFDVVNLEFPYLAHLSLRQSPPGTAVPPLVLDAHEVAYDLAAQIARSERKLARRVYGAVNWRKLRGEERAAFRTADGIYACSTADQARILADVPSARTAVIPNAADVEHYQPRPSDPPADGRTVVFFGLLSTVPNVDGIRFFVRDIWPRIVAQRTDARCRIIGARPHPSVLELAGPGVEVVGFVDDLRPHLAAAAAVVVPLRVGSGTRLKIVEAMAMGKPIVSTALGAEGIDATRERDILIADDPADFAAAVVRLLDDSVLRTQLGRSARELAVRRYSWSAAAASLERFFEQIIADRLTSTSTPSRRRVGETAARGAA